MNTLAFGFYGEGIRDYSFIMTIVRRTLEELVPHMDILPIEVHLDESSLGQIDKIVQVAEKTNG
jgi:hypothetical protein